MKEKIGPSRCNKNPATRLPPKLREYLIDFTHKQSQAHVCYACAQPFVIYIRRNIFKETGSDKQLLFNNIHDITHGTHEPAIPFVKLARPRSEPWPTAPHHPLNSRVRCPLNRLGRIIAFAPPMTEPTLPPVYYIKFTPPR